jgi:hypothetical protein
MDYLYQALSVTDIVSLVARSAPDHRPQKRINSYLKRDKNELLKTLLNDDQYWIEELYKIAIDNEEERVRMRREKRRRHAEQVRVARQEAARPTDSSRAFLDLPSAQDHLRCYAEAYNATSNAALAQHICAVCARRQLTTEAQFSRINVTDIPNRHRLTPHTPHPEHVLVLNCLLEAKGCHGSGMNPLVDVCKECLDDLRVCTVVLFLTFCFAFTVLSNQGTLRQNIHLPTIYGLEILLGSLSASRSPSTC